MVEINFQDHYVKEPFHSLNIIFEIIDTSSAFKEFCLKEDKTKQNATL